MLTVFAATIGYISKIMYFVHKVVQCSVDGIIKFRFQQALDDPVAVPIICKEHVSFRSEPSRNTHNFLGNVHQE